MKQIHGLWHDEYLPETHFIDSWHKMNPDANIKVWTFEEVEKLMCLRDSKIAESYDSMPFLLQRANALRVVILSIYGGIYLDLDMECLRPLDAFFEEDLVLGNTRPAKMPMLVCNAIIGAQRPGHHLWVNLLSAMLQCPKIQRDTEAIKTSGSILLTDVIGELALNHYVEQQSVFFPDARTDNGNAYTRHHAGRPAWVGKQFIDGKLQLNSSKLICK